MWRKRDHPDLLAKVCVILAFTAAPWEAWAEDYTSSSQMSVRIGLVSSNVSIGETTNKVTSTTSVPESLEFEYEMFSTNKRSFFFRGTMAYDLSLARVSYFFVGGGINFYLSGNAMAYDRSDNEGNRVAANPTSRFFLGPDFGLSKIEIVKQANNSASAAQSFDSTNFDIGAHIGYVLQLSKTFGIEALAGGSFVYGFTTVSAVGTSIRAMLGITQYF